MYVCASHVCSTEGARTSGAGAIVTVSYRVGMVGIEMELQSFTRAAKAPKLSHPFGWCHDTARAGLRLLGSASLSASASVPGTGGLCHAVPSTADL